jgi:hypothetical protein
VSANRRALASRVAGQRDDLARTDQHARVRQFGGALHPGNRDLPQRLARNSCFGTRNQRFSWHGTIYPRSLFRRIRLPARPTLGGTKKRPWLSRPPTSGTHLRTRTALFLSRRNSPRLRLMKRVFDSSIATYVRMCRASRAAFQRWTFGPGGRRTLRVSNTEAVRLRLRAVADALLVSGHGDEQLGANGHDPASWIAADQLSPIQG